MSLLNTDDINSTRERGQRSQSGRQRVPTRYTSGPTTAGTRRRDRRNRELLPTKGQEKQNGSYQATLNDRSLLSTPTRTRGQRLGKKNRYSHYTHYQRRAQTGPACGQQIPRPSRFRLPPNHPRRIDYQ